MIENRKAFFGSIGWKGKRETLFITAYIGIIFALNVYRVFLFPKVIIIGSQIELIRNMNRIFICIYDTVVIYFF